MRRLMLTTALALIAGATLAQDAALVLGNERYENLGRLSRGADITAATAGIDALGFDVTTLRNGRAETTAEAVADFISAVPQAERIIVALSGRFATDGQRTWLLTAESPAPGILALGDTAVSVDSVLSVLSRAPGRALLLLGVAADEDAVFDPWLSEGIGALDIPQGVTVVRGEPRDIAALLGEGLAIPEGDLAALIAENDDLRADGFLPATFVFMPALPDVVVPDTPDPDTAAADEALWRRVVAQDNLEAYRGYLRQFPDGRHTDEAEAAIAAILAEPFRDERLAEEALALTRDQRRDIQADLTTMGFDTRGIDGIFGQGTRRAIVNWQQENGFAQTGYVTMEQISRLDAQAARREAERAAEAERQRQEVSRLDRAYWEETGARGDEAGLRAYLNRYPDGIFAEIAADRLALLAEGARQEAAARDRAAWDAARTADTGTAYRQYLRDFPEGAFVADAQARIEALDNPAGGDDAARARAAEQALNLNGLTRRLVEQRLDALGLRPGAVDGTFDDATRRAIRRYQEEGGVAPTGYLDERTVVLLLAGVMGE